MSAKAQSANIHSIRQDHIQLQGWRAKDVEKHFLGPEYVTEGADVRVTDCVQTWHLLGQP